VPHALFQADGIDASLCRGRLDIVGVGVVVEIRK